MKVTVDFHFHLCSIICFHLCSNCIQGLWWNSLVWHHQQDYCFSGLCWKWIHILYHQWKVRKQQCWSWCITFWCYHICPTSLHKLAGWWLVWSLLLHRLVFFVMVENKKNDIVEVFVTVMLWLTRGSQNEHE